MNALRYIRLEDRYKARFIELHFRILSKGVIQSLRMDGLSVEIETTVN